jgi:predicted Zn finger-like uncharacterized protein
MIISCPNCSTRFSISDTAIPADGRTVRCSKCGTKWHQDPPGAAKPAPSEPKVEAPTPPEASPEPSPEPAQAASESADAAAPPWTEEAPEPPATEPAPDLSDIDVTAEEKPAEEAQPAVPELTAERDAEAVRPKVAKKPVVEEKAAPSGIMIGWIALAVLIVAVIGITFGFKESIVRGWPATARFYSAIGLGVKAPAPEPAKTEAPKPAPAGKAQFQTESVTTSTETVDGVDYRVVNGLVRNTGKVAAAVPEIRTRLSGEDRKVLSETVHKLPAQTLQPDQTVTFTVKIPNPPADARYLEVDTVSGD